MNRFDPYKSKIAVSTGSKEKGKSKFFAGSVKGIVNEWKSMGINIVPKNQAEYVIVPDGTRNFGSISAQPIYYSDFVNLLQEHPRPKYPHVTVKPEKTEKNHKDIELQNNLEFVKEDVGNQKNVVMIDFRKIQNEPIPQVPTPTVHNPQQFRYSLDLQSYLALMKYFAQEKTQNFVTDIFSKKFYYQVYDQKAQLLKKNIDSMHQLLRVWAELRINLEIAVGELPSRININDEKPCELDTDKLEYLKSVTPISECWVHYRTHFDELTQKILSDPETLKNIAQDRYPDIIQYFWEIESDLIVMYLSLLCAKYELKAMYLKWAKQVREKFEEKKYEEIPMIFVLEEWVTAFCVVENNSPEKKKLEENLKHLYEGWFHKRPPSLVETHDKACQQIRDMYGTIIATLKYELGLQDAELILWSEIPGLLNLNAVQWNDLFSKDPEKRKPVLQYLAKTIKSSDYRQKVVDVLASFQSS